MDDKGIGIIDKVWMGYTADQKVRLNASSGGIVTGSLLAMLRSGEIDGAVVNVADLDFPPHGKSILAKIESDLLLSAKSIYCVTEINRGLCRAKDDLTVEQVAVVGLPCQISALRQRLQTDEELKNKVVICLGIMCGRNMYAEATILALAQSGIDIQDVKKVTYRARGWFPFYYQIEMLNGEVKEILWTDSPVQKLWDGFKYMPDACKVCSDFSAEQADIACCDAWLEEHKGEQNGYSIVLTHTPLGTSYIENLIQANILVLNECDESYIQRSQYSQIARKLKNKRRRL